MIQGSREWFEARIGRLTASRIGEATKRTQKGTWGAERAAIMAELTAERLTGEAAQHFLSDAMKWGIVHQAGAAQGYTFITGRDVSEVGFVPHPIIPDSGASPDGFVGSDGLIEIKCPITKNHIATLKAALKNPGYVPEDYLPQIHWQIACTDRSWCDFVSYDPRMPAHLQVYTTRVERDVETIDRLEADARIFLAELAADVELLHAFGDRVADHPTKSDTEVAA